MSIQVNIDNSPREIPQVGDTNWGEKTTALLDSIVSAIHDRSRLSGNESISGIKTFVSPPVIPEPLNASNPIRKQDLDNFGTSLNAVRSSIATINSQISTVNNSINGLGNRIQENHVSVSANATEISNMTAKVDALIPVGTIIALHPYATAPDSQYWKLCNGRGTLGVAFAIYSNNTVPNLTDTFLMGGASHGTGGSNSKVLSSSNLPSHTHRMDHAHGTVDTDVSPVHMHYLSYRYAFYTPAGEDTGDRTWVHSGTTDGNSTAYVSNASGHSHSLIIPDFVGNTGNIVGTSGRSFDNRPKYFKAKYYIRVN